MEGQPPPEQMQQARQTNTRTAEGAVIAGLTLVPAERRYLKWRDVSHSGPTTERGQIRFINRGRA